MELDTRTTVHAPVPCSLVASECSADEVEEDGEEGTWSDGGGGEVVVVTTGWFSGERVVSVIEGVAVGVAVGVGVGEGVSPAGTASASASTCSTFGRASAEWTREGSRSEDAACLIRGFWWSSILCRWWRYCARSPSSKWEESELEHGAERGCMAGGIVLLGAGGKGMVHEEKAGGTVKD